MATQLPEYAQKAEELIKKHMELGMDEPTALKASVLTLSFALESGLYPLTKSLVQKQRNYLTGVGKVIRCTS